MLHIVVTSVCVISGFHVVLGLISIVVGIISSIKAEVWLAHSVSPIWSGGFFFITGILGIFCARRKTSYVIMCFTAFSVVSMVTAVVSIQLLRLGLVNHTTDGHTFQKQNKDMLIIVALAIAGSEILVCLLSTLLSCRMAKVAKEELCKRREGMFHVKAESDENDNDVIFSQGDCENPSVNSVDAVEIHVVGENDAEIQKNTEETENKDSEHATDYDISESELNVDKEKTLMDTETETVGYRKEQSDNETVGNTKHQPETETVGYQKHQSETTTYQSGTENVGYTKHQSEITKHQSEIENVGYTKHQSETTKYQSEKDKVGYTKRHSSSDSLQNSKQEKCLKDKKCKSTAKKSKTKEMKQPMQIFTVLEEEISDVSDIETPRTIVHRRSFRRLTGKACTSFSIEQGLCDCEKEDRLEQS